MGKSSKSIIEHIPLFLDYCEKVGLSAHTYKNYKIYLKKFILWLEKENKTSLLPHEITPKDIQAYKLYLSHHTGKKGRSLKTVTQNYYLIALRALLSYFTTKDIQSLLAARIALPRGFRTEKTAKFLNLDQIEKLLLAPNTSTPQGLRNRAILKTLISTGLKISQLTKLNKDQLSDISKEALFWIKKYLETRKDKNDALFINYNARRSSIGGRLTARSIERIVRHYGKKTNLPFSITPEILRWARALALLNKEIIIKKPLTHSHLPVDNYNIKDSSLFYLQEKEISPTWYSIENIIKKEVIWLKNNIPVLPETYNKQNPPFLKCNDCILRKIAILITSGAIKAIEFENREVRKDLWNGLTKKLDLKKVSRHGEKWHKKIMDVAYEYFKSKDCKIVFEPILNYGRADLGVYSDSNRPLFIEVDTVSLFKLWYNLATMKNTSFLIIPSENKAIEFKT